MKFSYLMKLNIQRGKILVASIAFFTFVILSLTCVYLDHIKNESYVRRYISSLAGTELERESGALDNMTVVLLFTNQRSGSTFLGEIFNENPKVFYMFEPLFPFTTNCETQREERVELLTELLQCNFENMMESYTNAFAVTNFTDSAAECMKNNLCFINNHRPLLQNYADVCAFGKTKITMWKNAPHFNPESHSCGLPLRHEHLSKICRGTDIKVFKILRVCKLQMLEPLYANLTDKGYRPFVIHLVRDPRAVMASRLAIHLDGINDTDMEEEAKKLCNRYVENIDYAENILSGGVITPNVISDGQYMRIRYEDISLKSSREAKNLYRFIGKRIPIRVKQWIQNSQVNIDDLYAKVQRKVLRSVKNKRIEQGFDMFQSVFRQNRNPFGTLRDPAGVLKKWRKTLPFHLVETIQQQCEEAMLKLNYTLFDSESDMHNLTLSYF